MGTRAGDIDPSLVTYLMRKLNITNADDMTDILNNESGLLGISGISPDLRDLMAVKDENPRAKLAVDMYINRIVKYIGSYISLMDGVDAIIFTAGTGENNPDIRSMIMEHFRYMGIKLDDDTNRNSKGTRKISSEDSQSDVLVIPTNEELMILRDVVRLTGNEDVHNDKYQETVSTF